MRGRPPRLALWEPYPHLDGGGQRTSRLLAGALRERGVQVVSVAPARGPHTEALDAMGIATHLVDLPPPLRTFGHRTTAASGALLPLAWTQLARLWRTVRPDVVAAANLRGMLLCGPSARVVGARTYWHVHLGEPNPRLNRLASTLADGVVVPSSAALEGSPGVAHRIVTVIPNAAAPDAFTGQDRALAPGPPRLVTSARLTPQKGLDTLIGAVAQLLEQHPGTTATVYGGIQSGYERHASDLRRLIAREDLCGAVRLVGPIDRPYRCYPDGAIYVQPSRQEILPLAILEAMAAGLPVVATRVGGVADAVVDGVTGLLVPPDDAAALAAAVGDLCSDPGRAPAMGIAGVARARARFSVDAMADRWLDLLTTAAR